MLEYSMKYGFITTYKTTMFLKQQYREEHDDWAVYISNPIEHTTKTQHMGGIGDKTQPSAFEGSVSLRQCMLYFLQCADGDFWAENPTEPDDWIKNRARKITKQVPATPESQGKKSTLFGPGVPVSLRENLDSERGIQSSGPTTRSAGLASSRSLNSPGESKSDAKPGQHASLSIRARWSPTAEFELMPTRDGNYKFFNKDKNRYQEVHSDDVFDGRDGKKYAKISGRSREVNFTSREK